MTHKNATSATVISEVEAAPYIGLSRAYLRQARARGTGPSYIRIGRAVRYSTTDLDEFLDKHRVITREQAEPASR